VSDYEGVVMLMALLPKITMTGNPSSPIPTADPRPLFWVVGVVLGVLALWVLYVVLTGQTRPPPPGSAEPKTSGEGAQ
jgi:hypothetical protein